MNGRRRPTRTLVGSAVLAIAGCSIAPGNARPPPPGIEALGEPNALMPECRALIDEVRFVAATVAPSGVTYEWWQAPTVGGGTTDIFTFGGGVGAGGTCTDDEAGFVAGDLTWSGGAGGDVYEAHGGHVPAGTVLVRLTFDDRDPAIVDIDVDDDLYFAVLRRLHGDQMVTKVDAIGEHGDLIETLDI